MTTNEKILSSFGDFLRGMVLIALVIAAIYLSARINQAEEKLYKIEQSLPTNQK